jgi:hypothetical protein
MLQPFNLLQLLQFNLQSANIVIIFDWSQRKSRGNHSPTVTWDINIPIYSIRGYQGHLFHSKNSAIEELRRGRLFTWKGSKAMLFLSVSHFGKYTLKSSICIRFEEIDPVIICNCQVSNALILRLHLPTHQVVKTQMFNTRPQET